MSDDSSLIHETNIEKYPSSTVEINGPWQQNET